MLTRTTALVALSIGCAIAAPAHAQPETSSPPALNDAIAEASAAGKPLLIEVYTTWCGPCKRFAADVLPNEDVQRALSNVVFVQYDAEDKSALDVVTRFNVSGYPTFLALDSTGELKMRDMGAPATPASFIAMIEQAGYATLTAEQIEQRVAAASHDADVLMGAARWYEAQGDRDATLKYYRKAARASDDSNPDAAWVLLKDRLSRKVRRAMVGQLAAYLRRHPDADNATEVLRYVALSGSKKAGRVGALARQRLAAIRDDPGALNALVYVLLAARQYDVALLAAERQVELRAEQANPYDTLAEVHHYRREREQALEAADRAIELASSDRKPGFSANRERFAAEEWAPSPDVEDQRRRRDRLAYEVTSRPDPQPVSDTPMSADRAARHALRAATRHAYRTAGKRCADVAGELPEAYVRVELPRDGGRATKVTVLEPEASRRLRRCLTKRLRAETWPPLPDGTTDRITRRIDLDPDAGDGH